MVRNQKFDCKRCGLCCRFLVRLDDEDIDKIKAKGHKDFFETKKNKHYMKRINYYCYFLKLDKGMCSCKIYNYRPKICKNFPKVKVFGKDAYDYRCSAFKLPGFLRRF